MIIADKDKTISNAHEISKELIDILAKRCVELQGEDDPAENTYLFVHVSCLLNIKVCIALERYGHIYGIDKMPKETIFEWIKETTGEYLKNFREKMDD